MRIPRKLRMGMEWAIVLMTFAVPLVPTLMKWPGGEGWPGRIAFAVGFWLYFAVAGGFLLWALESSAFIGNLTRGPQIAALPMVGLALGAPAIFALGAGLRWMQVPRPWTPSAALGVWICGCVLLKRIRGWRAARAGQTDLPPG